MSEGSGFGLGYIAPWVHCQMIGKKYKKVESKNGEI